jgi:uncharacterized protein
MNLEQIEKLNELKEKGMITEEEFLRAKEKILAGETVNATPEVAPHTAPVSAPKPIEIKTNNFDYAMMMHLAQFASILIPLLGLIIPLVMWQSRKNDDDYIDQQGKVVMNWALSSLIYAVVSWILVFVLIGFVLLFALFICSIIFIIMGSINANKGVVKNYPLSIRFFDVTETTQV